MDTALKMIGARLQKFFGDPTKSAMGWNLIDAFTRLEEREEALRDGDDKADSAEGPSCEAHITGPLDKDR
jgi:hypothetical protein